MSDIKGDTQGRWKGILKQLGIADEYLINKHGPCPVCGGLDRYRFDDKDGEGTYYCGGCGAGDGISLLMKFHGWDFKKTVSEIKEIIGMVEYNDPIKKKDPTLYLKKISNGTQKLTGKDPASIYIESRGLGLIPTELRFHPAIRYYEDKKLIGTFCAMLAIVRNQAGSAITYHVTYLTDDGKKADVPCPKKIMTAKESIRGASIRLFGSGTCVCVTEGVETGIAAYEATGLPVLVAMNTSGIESLKVIEGVTKVIIYADNDINFAGQKAAFTLANRLSIRDKIDVKVLVPAKAGSDFLDEWTG